MKMSQAFYPTNDGHIGNLSNLTVQELTDLIHRQSTLLQKRKFIQKLPDKGKKSRELLEKLNEELSRRQSSIRSTDFTTSESISKDGQQQAIDVDGFEKAFDRLSVDDSNEAAGDKPKHMFEIAEERSKLNAKDIRPSTRLNQNLRASHVEDLPDDIKSTQPVKKNTTEKTVLIPEESAAVPPSYKFNEAKIIPLEESLHLQREQKEKLDKVQAIAAAKKLSQRVGIKMDTYNPEGIDMSYRGVTQDIESDSENEDDKQAAIFDEDDDVD